MREKHARVHRLLEKYSYAMVARMTGYSRRWVVNLGKRAGEVAA
jgi:hypothetical protein